MNKPSERARKKAQEILDHYYKSHQERCDYTDILNEIVEAFHIDATTKRILSYEETDVEKLNMSLDIRARELVFERTQEQWADLVDIRRAVLNICNSIRVRAVDAFAKAIEEFQDPRMRGGWPTEDQFENLILTWQMSWMYVKGTDERDRKNYFERATGIDANMRYGLAKKLREYLTQYTPPQNTTASTESIPDMVSVSREMLEQWLDAILSLRDSMYPHPHEHSAMYQAKENSKEALASIERVLEGEKS